MSTIHYLSHRILTLFLLANDWNGLTFTIVLFYKGTRCPLDVIDVIRFLMITSAVFWMEQDGRHN